MALLHFAPRGTKDALPADIHKWQYVEKIARETAADFGFTEIRFPTFEHTELFIRGVGDTTDVVSKEMYTFTDKGGRSLSLRPEGTASVVRSFLENSLYAKSLPVKVFYIAPNFRYEAPQDARLREHHQFGVEVFGADSPAADAEIIDLAATYIERLGIRGVSLEINSLGCPDCRPRFHDALKDYFHGQSENLCPTCRDRLDRNPLRILDCKNPQCGKTAEKAPVGLHYLCRDCGEHLSRLEKYLTDMDIPYIINPKIVRGLDYYTRTVFEFVSTQIGSQGTVCGGGRYDGLVSALGGDPTPGLGFGSGIERMMRVMEAEGISMPDPDSGDLFIAALGEQADPASVKLLHDLRRRGVSAQRDLCGRSLKAQMKYAHRIRVKYVMVLGDNEISAGRAQIRHMETGVETPCSLEAGAIEAIVKQ